MSCVELPLKFHNHILQRNTIGVSGGSNKSKNASIRLLFFQSLSAMFAQEFFGDRKHLLTDISAEILRFLAIRVDSESLGDVPA